MAKKKILVVFGTRPEAVKMCPLVLELKARGCFDVKVCVSGQHGHMLRQVLDIFKVRPQYDLKIMKPNQSLFDVTARTLEYIKPVLQEAAPDLMLVHGDTATAFAASLAAFYSGADVGHVEAGLRTGNIKSPYPEEYNRRAISLVARYSFAPTPAARENLLAENCPPENIFVTGNTVIDALKYTVRPGYHSGLLDWARGSRLLLVTAHRRESLGGPMRGMLRGIRRVLDEYPGVKAVYPVHLNPGVGGAAREAFAGCKGMRLIKPMDVAEFHNTMARCHLVLTDSGGIQEEAPSLNKPVLVMRDVTERPEGLKAGTLRLVGSGEQGVYEGLKALLDDPVEYGRMSAAENPYGDGSASAKIADILEEKLC